MPTSNEQLHATVHAILAHQVRAQADAIEGMLAAWVGIDAKFASVIGPSGVRLIYIRSIDAARHAFPWLAAAVPPGEDAGAAALAPLAAALRKHAPLAATANDVLLDHFIDLLATLIGARLTMQILRSAFPDACPTENSEENQE
ncbi:MAG: hypothetical protein V4582_06735 [Pseudomonadota bacterium]